MGVQMKETRARRKPRPPGLAPRWFLVRYALRGGHYHTTWFVANHPQQTYADMGSLVMDEQDFAALQYEHAGNPKFKFVEW